MRLGAGPENFKDQCGAINHLAFDACFQIALLHRGQGRIHHDDRIIMFFCYDRNPVNKAGAKKGWRTRLVQADNFSMHHLEADGGHQLHRLIQHGFRPAGQRHGADVGMDNKCRRCAQNGLLRYDGSWLPESGPLLDR